MPSNDLSRKECRPIFVIGSARSGTSIIVTALKEAGIPGYLEGHYLPILQDLSKTAREYYDVRTARDPQAQGLNGRIPFETFISDLLEMARMRYEAQFPDAEVWFDKSPDAPTIRIIPYIVKMWPSARFVFMKRRALENMVSRLKKFPHLSFKENCERWVLAMRIWKQNRELLPEGSYIEIDQRDVALDPAKTGESLGAFLGFDASQIKKVVDAFTLQRPESTGGDETKPLTLETTGWSAQQKAIYASICSTVNEEFGYSEDENYYSKK